MSFYSRTILLTACASLLAFHAMAQSGQNTPPPPPPRLPADMGGNDSRPILIMGSVVTEDGSPLPRGISIKSICSGKERIVAYPHGEGKFEFRWGDTSAASQPDATQAELDTSTSKLGGLGLSTKPGSSLGGVRGDQITDCELGVNAAGYRSSMINLYNHSSTSNPDVGVIILHRIGATEGHFVSAAAMQAPKDAKKAWDEGMLSLQKNQRPEALASFQKAVKAYPTFADAWLRIGILQVQLHGLDAGNDAFLKAMEADNKLVGPWQELGFVAAAKTDWPQTAHYLDEAVKLDPVSSPKAWYLDATAHYNLKHYDEAERTARMAIKLDTKHQNPRADFLLGLILIAKEDYRGGAALLKSYIDEAPNAGDIAMVRGELERIQEFIR